LGSPRAPPPDASRPLLRNLKWCTEHGPPRGARPSRRDVRAATRLRTGAPGASPPRSPLRTVKSRSSPQRPHGPLEASTPPSTAPISRRRGRLVRQRSDDRRRPVRTGEVENVLLDAAIEAEPDAPSDHAGEREREQEPDCEPPHGTLPIAGGCLVHSRRRQRHAASLADRTPLIVLCTSLDHQNLVRERLPTLQGVVGLERGILRCRSSYAEAGRSLDRMRSNSASALRHQRSPKASPAITTSAASCENTRVRVCEVTASAMPRSKVAVSR
jgi:hypothetical protein